MVQLEASTLEILSGLENRAFIAEAGGLGLAGSSCRLLVEDKELTSL